MQSSAMTYTTYKVSQIGNIVRCSPGWTTQMGCCVIFEGDGVRRNDRTNAHDFVSASEHG